MNGEGHGGTQDWDAYPPGAYAPPPAYGSRRSPGLLFGAALASVGVLVLVAVVGSATLYGDSRAGVILFVGFALPLPVLTAVFARQPRVRGWAAAG
jgi:hypothetical protein